MGFAVFSEGKRFSEKNLNSEEDFEQVVKTNSKLLFGPNTIYMDFKSKVESQWLGGVVPDGFLFDLSDSDDLQFYLVEVELRKHDFMRHVFPQITKFFAFYRNSSSRSKLIGQLYQFISENSQIKKEFQQLLVQSELYKSLTDILENSQNILLIADDPIPEIKDIQDTYTDTWGKYVKVATLKAFIDNGKQILVLNPGFEELKEVEATSPSEVTGEEGEIYSEAYHTEGLSSSIVSAYNKLKQHMAQLDDGIIFNPQHYYVSIRKNRNFAFIRTRKNKLKIVVMLPIQTGNEIVKNHKIRQLGEGVQNFYNGPCFEVQVESDNNLEEIFKLLEHAYKKQA